MVLAWSEFGQELWITNERPGSNRQVAAMENAVLPGH